MQWIKHDTDANQDAKLQNVLLDYGLEGYGLYWYCIELIAGKVDKDNITFELEHDARIIARNVGSTPQKVEEMMRYFVKIGLFENTQGVITCLKLAKRLDQSMTSNPQMREIIKNFKGLHGHDKVMISHDEVMQDKIRLDKTIKDKEPSSQFDYELVAEIWNRSCDESNTPSKKCRVVSEATKKNMPVTYKKHCAIRKAGGHEPLDRVEFCESYFPAVLNWGSSFVGKSGQHENWKMNLEHASKIGTYDKVAEWLAND